jgi:predicted MFS family arabinose efflux permease
MAIIVTAFPEGRARSRAVSVYALFGASGFSAGLLLSGLLTEVSWRWTFAFPAPIALLLFAFGLRLIPRDAPEKHPPRHYDAVGALTLTGATLLLVHAITSVAEAGWGHPHTVGAFTAAGLLLYVFVRTERTVRQPLLPLELVADRRLVRSALGAAALNGSYLGLLFLLTLQLQRDTDWTPLRTALALLPAGVPLALSALHSGRMVGRFGPARLIALGAVFPPVGYALLLRVDTPVRYVSDVLPTLLLVATGFVLSFTALHVQATSTVPAGRQAAAGGVYQTAVQMGAALTLALVAALQTAGAHHALVLVTAVGVLALVVALDGVLRQ